MAFSDSDILTLESAIKSGVLSVRYDGPPGRTIVYQSLAEMRKLLAQMRGEVATAEGRKPYRFASTRKGFVLDEE